MLYLIRAFLDANNGDMDGMRSDMAAAAELFRCRGERWGLATSLSFLAYAELTLGGFDDAAVALEESIRLRRELDPGDDAVLECVWLAQAQHRKGDVAAARARLRELVERAHPTSAWYRVYARIALGDLARHDGHLDEAARHYLAVDLDGLPTEGAFHAMIGSALGNLAVDTGESETARQHLAEGFAAASATLDMPLVATVAVAVARLRDRQGAGRDATEVLGAAEALRGSADRFHPDVERLVTRLRAALGECTYQAAYARGRGLDRAGALALIEASLG